MEDQLISFETAKLANEKKFFEVCERADHAEERSDESKYFVAPTQSLLQRWLREEHIIYVSVERAVIGSDEWDYGYKIEWLPKPHHSEKRRSGFFQEKQSFQELIGSYIGAWSKYEEALEKGLQEALKLIS